MELVKKIYSKVSTVIYVTCIVYTVAMLVFAGLVLCGVIPEGPFDAPWDMVFQVFALGYLAVVAFAAVTVVISLAVLLVMCIRDRDMFKSRVLPRLKHFAIGLAVGLLLEVIFYFSRGYFSPSTPLCCGFLFLYSWPRKKAKKDEDDT